MVNKGWSLVKKYSSSKGDKRCFCTKCDDQILSDHLAPDIIDGFASVLEELALNSCEQANYVQVSLPMLAGLQKFGNFPNNLGGTGEMIYEYWHGDL